MVKANDCPDCGDPMSVHGVCGSCGYGGKFKGKSKPKHDPEAAHWAHMAMLAKERYLNNPATSADLTEQQWYNVCKFWPNVAAHCKRPRPIVGPNHQLDVTSRRGPLTRGVADALPHRRGYDPDAIEERLAIEGDA